MSANVFCKDGNTFEKYSEKVSQTGKLDKLQRTKIKTINL
jgi:hypothetical protein